MKFQSTDMQVSVWNAQSSGPWEERDRLHGDKHSLEADMSEFWHRLQNVMAVPGVSASASMSHHACPHRTVEDRFHKKNELSLCVQACNKYLTLTSSGPWHQPQFISEESWVLL